jgi:predicted dehydrogenase
MATLRIGVLGCGYWGPNHIRTFSALRAEGAEMVIAADLDDDRRKHVGQLYPWMRVVSRAEEVIEDPSLDAVVVATPVHTHYPFARQALLHDKHVLVEKPFVTEIGQAEELIALAAARGKVLMVGHTFEYTAAVNRIRELVAAGELGDVLYVRSLRVNLGLYQKDINVLWDLAPHDVSILLYVLQEMPHSVSAVGSAHVTEGVEDVVTLTLEFSQARMATVIVSWLDPRKVREMTIVGNRKMLVYDDVSANEKIRIYDKGVDGPRRYDSFGEFQYSYRYGDIVTPVLREYEPLRAECSHFLECAKTGAAPRSSGAVGLRVTRILSAASLSLREGGRKVRLDEPPSGQQATTGTFRARGDSRGR